jgi:hypothetical protein
LIPALRLLIATTFLALTGLEPCVAAVQVLLGPTPIEHGDARAAGDITVVNERLAFALAVQSAAPYGVPRGALIDLAPVVDGKIGRDRVVFADFIPNHWSAWPSTYQHVEIVERGPERAVIHTTRDWGRVVIATDYILRADSDRVEIRTTMTNGGDAPLPDLLSGLTLWPSSGYLFSVPGMAGVSEGKADAALADRVVAYDEDWAIALHASYFDHVGDESRDMYLLHTLAAGESRVFEGWLQVRAKGDLAPIVQAEIEHDHLKAGRVQGTVRGRDGPIDSPVVVIEKGGKPYAWVAGRAGTFDVALPAGDYALYATAKNYSQSASVPVHVQPDSHQTLDFRGLEAPGQIHFVVTEARSGKPLDARLKISEGQKPVVEYLGRQTFFTELDRRGMADVAIAPGKYVFSVSSGGGFLGPPRQVTVEISPRGSTPVKVALTRLFDPTAKGWYAADLHHHADQAEAVTPPADLARSQLAAGLDLLFVSDHDSTVNHQALQGIAHRRGMPFIPGVELSPSWGHFNAYPLTLAQPLRVDTSVATVDEIFREARRQGALVVQVNHPFIPYGYFTSVANGVAPGGFNPAFDLMEINDSAPEDDDKVLRAVWDSWNAGHHYFLSAGTDTHDVWNAESGRVRTYAHVDGAVSAKAFALSLKQGHGYVTRGPLVFPAMMFGSRHRVKAGATFGLTFDLDAVDGVKRVDLIGEGKVLASQFPDAAPREAHVVFPSNTAHSTWYSLVVEDGRGRRAYTDPIWIDTAE